METLKATKVTEVEYSVISGKTVAALFQSRVKSIEILGTKYNIRRKGGEEGDFVLESIAGEVLSDGNVVTSDGYIYDRYSDFKKDYKVVKKETSKDDE